MLKLKSITTALNNQLLRQLQGDLPAKEKLTERGLWGYVAIAFNRVDEDRLKLVGPDRLCAEWLLKNGGAIRMLDAPSLLWKDYNCLPPVNVKFRVKVVDASGASIMKIGLEHFKGCNNIDTVIFHECKHLEGDGLEGLIHLKETLSDLQVSGCSNIADEGLKVIGELRNLRNLKIFDMKYVKDLQAVINELQQKLPNCEIDTRKPE